jgi:hypothetical protein
MEFVAGLLLIGFICGYSVRALISPRHRGVLRRFQAAP